MPLSTSKALAELDPNSKSAKTASQPNTLSKPSNFASQKRGHSAISVSDDDDENEDAFFSDGTKNIFLGSGVSIITEDCDKIRRKITSFIDSGAMKVGEFQKTIGVSSAAYRNFMNQNGKMKGQGCDAYFQASKFFKMREAAGQAMPKAKKAKTAAKSKEDEKRWDVSEITLEDEAEGEIEVYETCDSMRKMINAHLRRDGITAASLCREISKCFGDESKKISSAQLSSFRKKHGVTSGNSSAAFYGAYVFFEKLRIKEKKPKSQFRLDMEDLWSRQGGFDLQRNDGHYIVPAGVNIYIDKYGKTSCQRGW